MQYFVVGLGNPGREYENTRHNTGAMVLDVFRKAKGLTDWIFDKKRNALVSSGKLKSCNLNLILPQTFMNKSGEAVRQIKDLKSSAKGGSASGGKNKRKEIKNLVVIHDDLDIPFGSYKISFNKSFGGHRGVESIIKAVKTEAFVRVRVGISQTTAKGLAKKPSGEVAVEKHILGKFSPEQLVALKKLSKRISEGLTCLIIEGREKAMSQYHS